MWEAGDEVMCPLTAQQVPNVCALPHQVPTPTMSKTQCLKDIKKKQTMLYTVSHPLKNCNRRAQSYWFVQCPHLRRQACC